MEKLLTFFEVCNNEFLSGEAEECIEGHSKGEQ
jgi:hypothetical protein